MPDKPKTQHRSVRVDTERWEAADRNAKALGIDRAKWINEALAWLNREPRSKMPRRPKPPESPDSP